jgi:hypothetical protein
MTNGDCQIDTGRGRRALRAGGLGVLLCVSPLPAVVAAADTTTFTAARITGEGWTLRDLRIEVPIGSEPGQTRAAHLSASRAAQALP